jgi:subtilisin family serine protease
VKIAVVDTGIKKTHEDAGGSRILQGFDFYNNDSDPNDQGSGCSYHGSHTAGTAAASTNNGKGIAGVAQASILPIKIFNMNNPGPFGCATTTTAIVNGLKYAGDQGAHVSSNSWGGGSFSTAINDAITYAHNKGVNHAAAAGNSGSCTNCVGEPWKSAGDRAVVVSCSTASDTFCSFSSQGPQVDVIAPGSSILSVDGAGTTGYKSLSGTSMSTPHVAGVLGLIETRFPGISFADAEGRIKSSADNLGLTSDRQGAGRLDGQGAIA